MQRMMTMTLLASVAATPSALAQPVQANPYYPVAAQPTQMAAAQPRYGTPQYQQQQYAPQPQYAPPVQPQRSGLGGGFIEFIFTGGGQQTRGYEQPAPQVVVPVQPVMQPVPVQPYVPQRPVVHASLPPQRPDLNPRYLRQVVAYHGKESPGTIIINTPERLLYLVQEDGKALRYGIGVGRPGFTWAGVHHITAKKEWPDWRPPKEMLQRRPELPTFMEGGPDNPLGARALYLGSTLYRIHGSNEPWTIGTQVSSGCIRMRNEDVIDLYERVDVGAKVMVI